MIEVDGQFRDAITELTGTIFEHIQDDAWRDHVLKIIFDDCRSSDPHKIEVTPTRLNSSDSKFTNSFPSFQIGFASFDILAANAPFSFRSHSESVCTIFATTIIAAQQSGSFANPAMLSIFHAMTCLTKCFFNNDNVKAILESSIPFIIKMLKRFSAKDSQHITEMYNILECLVICTPKLLNKWLKTIIKCSLKLLKQVDVAKVICVVAFIKRTISRKNEAICQAKLIEPIVESVFTLLTAASENNNETNLKEFCLETIQKMACRIPSEELLRALLPICQKEINSTCTHRKEAAYMSFACIAEGCRDVLWPDYHQTIMDHLKIGVTDESHSVRNAAYCAIAHFCEHLQPEICKYTKEIQAISLQVSQNITNNLSSDQPDLKYMISDLRSMEMIGRNLNIANNSLDPLFATLNANTWTRLRKLTLLFSSDSAGQSQPIEILATLSTLNALAGTKSKEKFKPMAEDMMTFVLKSLDEWSSHTMEQRTSLYNLLTGLARILTVSIEKFLPKIVEHMVMSIRSTSNEIACDNSSEKKNKAEAINVLKSLSRITGEEFKAHIQQSFDTISSQLDNPSSTIRKAAIEALTQLILSLFGLQLLATIHRAQVAATEIITKFAEMLNHEEELFVSISIFKAFTELLENMKSKAICKSDVKDKIFHCVNDVMSLKLKCQINASQANYDDEKDFLVELAELGSKVFIAFGEAVEPVEFNTYFGRLLPTVDERLKNAKKNEDLELVYGTVSDSFHVLKENTGNWFDRLLPSFLNGLQEEYKQVRHNAAFGLGELVLHAGEKAFNKYPEIINAFLRVFKKEKHASVRDNVCGAIARLIIANNKLVPMEQVLLKLVENLPLSDDFDENNAVFKSFHILLDQNNATMVSMLGHIISISFNILSRREFNEDDGE